MAAVTQGPTGQCEGTPRQQSAEGTLGLSPETANLPGSLAEYSPIGPFAVALTTICAEMPLAAAKDGLVPERFGRLSDRGVPQFGIVSSTVLASVAMVLSYMGSAGYTVFNTLVFMSGITAAIPYAFSALAQIKWRLQDNRVIHTPRFGRDVTVAVVAIVFSVLFIVYSRNTGEDLLTEYLPFILAGVAFLLGIPVYLAQRTHMTEPLPVPPYRP
jgi:basic amino acid/polyamine antiporter, APA family